MRLRNILFHSILGNISTFKGYYIATSFSVMIFFMNSMLTHHPDIPLEAMQLGFQKAITVINLIEFIFLSFFIAYSATTYIKQRSRDYAMFKILGMKQHQLNLLYIGENSVIYFFGILTGIIIGFILSKLFFMLISTLFDLPIISLYFPFSSIIRTFAWFGSLCLIINLFTFFLLKHTSVKSIIQLGRKIQKTPRVRPLLAILSFLLIIGGYFLAFTSNSENILGRFIPVSLVIIVGTYIFYHQGCAFALRQLANYKKMYYRGINILWISDLSYRIKDFTAVLFLTTIIMAVGFVSISSIYSVTYNVSSLGGKNTPYTEAIKGDPSLSRTYADSIKKIFEQNHIKYTHQKLSYKTKSTKKKVQVYIPQSTIEQLDASLFSSPEKKTKKEMDHIDKQALAKQMLQYVAPKQIHIISNAEYALLTDSIKSYSLHLFHREDKSAAGRKLQALTRSFYEKGGKDYESLFISIGAEQYSFVYGIRFALILGLSFAGIFFISAGSMLYFKFFNHLQQEKEKYANFRKIGLSTREVIRSSRIQMGILFFLPNLLAVTHAIFAIKAFSNMAPKESNFALPVIEVFGIILIIQIIYFIFFNRQYNLHLLRSIQRKSNH